MKNILYGAMLCAALFMLVFAGCSNSMDLSPKIETGVKITITSDINGARTAYPTQPVFTKYALELTGEWAWQDDEKEYTLTNGQTSITIPLTPGKWNIKVTGFTKIKDTEYAAAEGERTVTVTKNGIVPASINISAIQNYTQHGFLSFSATYPEEAVSKAELYIYHVGNNYYDYRPYGELTDEEYTPLVRFEIEPAYYMLTLLLDVKDSLGNYYRTVAWNEVIHIYSGMETSVEKTFTEDDLNRFITVGGPLNVTVNGDVPDEVYVRLYRDVNYEDSVGFAYSTTDTWQTSIPVVLNTPVVFYLIVEAKYEGISFLDKCGSVTVNNADINNHAINVTFSGTETITLSGTADVKINNVAAEEVWIAAYLASDVEIRRIQVLSDDGSWQMLLPLRHIGATVSFHVIAIDRGKGYDLSKPAYPEHCPLKIPALILLKISQR